MQIRSGLCAILVGLALSNQATAQSIVESFTGFTSTTGLQMNGTAATTTTSDGTVLRLVSTGTSEAGSAFTSSTVNIAGFSTAFDFRLSNPGGISDGVEVGADGFTFTLQTVGAGQVGGSGGSLGYDGISHSIAVEFDTFQNSGDPSSNFIAIHTNGNTTVANTPTPITKADFDNNTLWTAWIDYNGTTHALEVRVSDNGLRPSTANLPQTIDISTTLGSNATMAFIGFTAGTGSGFENTDIVNWSYSDSFVNGGISSVQAIPEPDVTALMALGLVPLWFARRGIKRPRT